MNKQMKTFISALALLLVPGMLLVTGCTTSAPPTPTTTTSTPAVTTTNGTTSSGAVSNNTPTTTAPGNTSGGVTGLDGEPADSAAGGGSGSSVENTQGLVSQGIVAQGSKRFNGQLNISQYGGPTDGTPDKYTAAGLGNRNNRLNSQSLALSPDLIKKHGLRGGESISIKTPKGTFFLGKYDDTTGNKNEPNVIDVYDPGDRLGKDSFMGTIPSGQWELVIG